MAEEQLTLLIPKEAQSRRLELLEALRAADNPSAWMNFMEVVTRLLPEVLSAGRPTAESIEKSLIGELGFKSWSEMIESPNGLAWNVSGWKAWRRAWATVQENPWLRSQRLTSSEVNTIARTYTPFPSSIQELENLKTQKNTALAQQKAETIAELKAEIEARGEIIGALTRQLNEQMQYNIELARQLGEETARRQAAESERQVFTWWMHFRALFFK